LKVGENAFVSLGNAEFLHFVQGHVANIIGLDKEQAGLFMDIYLYSKYATARVNPEEDNTNTLLKTFLRAAKQKKDEDTAERNYAFFLSKNRQRPGESDRDYAFRIDDIKKELADQERTDPKNCSQNFPLYLRTPVDAIIGIGVEHRGQTIYEFLVDSLGSSLGGFAKQYRNQIKGYDDTTLRQIKNALLQPAVQQGFIGTLCKSGVALQILGTFHSEDIDGSYHQPSPGDDYYRQRQDSYRKNVWRSLRLCLEQLEIYILNNLNEMLPAPPLPAPPSSAPNNYNIPLPSAPPLELLDGGKSKSRSKSIRKKRISHRKKKSHSHKRRAPKRLTPKRLTPKRRTVNQ
jgi:hypothetical protein